TTNHYYYPLHPTLLPCPPWRLRPTRPPPSPLPRPQFPSRRSPETTPSRCTPSTPCSTPPSEASTARPPWCSQSRPRRRPQPRLPKTCMPPPHTPQRATPPTPTRTGARPRPRRITPPRPTPPGPLPSPLWATARALAHPSASSPPSPCASPASSARTWNTGRRRRMRAPMARTATATTPSREGRYPGWAWTFGRKTTVRRRRTRMGRLLAVTATLIWEGRWSLGGLSGTTMRRSSQVCSLSHFGTTKMGRWMPVMKPTTRARRGGGAGGRSVCLWLAESEE
ncbi:hypothetical protein C8R46DRAFT_1251995, partial [Mycena filopes]